MGWRLVLALVLIVAWPLANAQRPLDFTADERTQFVDAPRQLRRVELPLVAHNAGAAGWLDASHVIYSTREITGAWKAREDEYAKVVVFDVQARTVSETPYRGNLVCFTKERMLVSQPRDARRPGFSKGLHDDLLAGRFGEPLQRLEDEPATAIVPLDCGVRPIVPAGAESGAPTEIPLRAGDGLLRVPRGGGSPVSPSALPSDYQLFDAGGRLVTTFAGDRGRPSMERLHYIPWLQAYFSDKGSLSTSELIWPDGQRRLIGPPAMLASFNVANNVGSSLAAPSRAGMLWNLVTWRSYWRMQGIYLLDAQGTLKRIEDASVTGQPRIAVSDDGCRVFYMRRKGDPLDARLPFVPTVLELCEATHK